jgi:hypothetical protein
MKDLGTFFESSFVLNDDKRQGVFDNTLLYIYKEYSRIIMYTKKHNRFLMKIILLNRVLPRNLMLR